MTRSEYEKQANGEKDHELYTPSHDSISVGRRIKPRHATICACRFDSQMETTFDEREAFAAIYLGKATFSDEEEESPERDSEDEEQPTVGRGSEEIQGSDSEKKIESRRVATFALYSLVHKRFIAILDKDRKIIEIHPKATFPAHKGTTALCFIIPLAVALEMHSSAHFESLQAIKKIEREQFITEGQIFYAQLCTRAQSAAL